MGLNFRLAKLLISTVAGMQLESLSRKNKKSIKSHFFGIK